MNKILIILAALFIASICPAAEKPQAQLEAGNYLLVYRQDESNPTTMGSMKFMKVSFSKTADDKLVFKSSEAPASPTAVFQDGPIFQFTVLKPKSTKDEGDHVPFENYLFVGKEDFSRAPGVFAGAVACIPAYYDSGAGVGAASNGTFLLYKLSQ